MSRLFGAITKAAVSFSITIPPVTPAGRGMHGWGIACYHQNIPAIQKGKRTTLDPVTNQSVGFTVTSTIIVSHIRFATSGGITAENAHPFEFSSWVFAHSGTVNREKLIGLLKPPYNQNYQSDPVDSEVYFRFLLQSMKEQGEIAGLKQALGKIEGREGATFLLSDGQTLYAFSSGIPLYWLYWHEQQAFSGSSPTTGAIYASAHLATQPAVIVSSDRLSQDNWKVMDQRELIIVRKNLQYEVYRVA
jgi:predicted glutamine amidotransferase